MKLLKNINLISRTILICFFIGNSLLTFAQNPFGGAGNPIGNFGASSSPSSTKSNRTNTKAVRRPVAKRDTLHSIIPDSLRSHENGLQTTVNYSAEDSTVLDVNGKVVHLYGKAIVDYGNVNLQADYIRLDWDKNEVFAHGSVDTSKTSGVKGKPIFAQGNETYNTDTIRYNFKSRKAIIKGIVTQQGDGFVQGQRVKKEADDDLYLMDAKYTTCNLKDPHFYINARRIKMVNKKQIISGSFNFVINDIPLPIGLPFGFFPIPKNKELGTPGVIIGTYGEEPNGRGFYLRDFGYYIPINEHIGGRVTGEIYSKGSWGVGINTQYLKKYAYGGSLDFRYNVNKPYTEYTTSQMPSEDFRLTWSHSPQSKRPDRSFSAQVNLVSNSYNKNNAYLTQVGSSSSYLNNTFGSSIQYSRTITKNIRFGTSLRVDQNVSTKVLNLGLDYTLGLTSLNPFVPEKKKIGRWYESFRIGVDVSGGFTATNDVTYAAKSYTLTDYNTLGVTQQQLTATELKNQSLGINTTTQTLSITSLASLLNMIKTGQFHSSFSVPITLPNFKIARYINFSPSVSLQGDVYTKKMVYQYFDSYNQANDIYYSTNQTERNNFYGTSNFVRGRTLPYTPGTNGVLVDTVRGFFPTFKYSFAGSFNTRVYGTYHFGKNGRLQAIRHTISPSISIGYTPDLTSQFSQFSRIRYDSATATTHGNYVNRYLPKYIGASSVSGAVGNIGFSLAQQLEAKIRSKSDTAANEFKKISLLDNFNISANYNMLVPDSLFKLSNINMSASTQLLKGLISLNSSASFDPYTYIKSSRFASGIRDYHYAISTEHILAHLTNLNVSVSTRLTPATFGGVAASANTQNTNNINDPAKEAQMKFIKQNPDLYVDFKIPWSVSISYNLNYSKNGLAPSLVTQALTFQGDFSLTPKWKISYNTGWDFQFKTATLTSINIHRDLHCWDMAFSWTPIAGSAYRVSSFSFDLKPKSAILQALKLSKRRVASYNGGF